MERAHQIDGHGTGGCFALRGREMGAQLADPWFAVALGDMACRKRQAAAAEKGYEGRHWLR
jgi:hypothetical protein